MNSCEYVRRVQVWTYPSDMSPSITFTRGVPGTGTLLINPQAANVTPTIVLPTNCQVGDFYLLDIDYPIAIKFDPGSQGVFVKNGVSSTAGQKLQSSVNPGDSCEIIVVNRTPTVTTWRVRNPVGSWSFV